jgi:hypothetical protein
MQLSAIKKKNKVEETLRFQPGSKFRSEMELHSDIFNADLHSNEVKSENNYKSANVGK